MKTANKTRSDSQVVKPVLGRLGTSRRKQMLVDAGLHPDTRSNVYSVYSPKARQRVLLLGDLHYLNFLRCESDPLIVAMTYRPDSRLFDPQRPAAKSPIAAESVNNKRVKTLIELTNSKKEPLLPATSPRLTFYKQALEEDIKTKRVNFRSVGHSVLNEHSIIAGNEISLVNWHNMIPYLSQTRWHSLDVPLHQVRDYLNRGNQVTLRTIVNSGYDTNDQALLVAATITGLAKGLWTGDIAEKLFGFDTLITRIADVT